MSHRGKTKPSRFSTASGSVQAARRLGWGLSDQALSSLTNFAVSIAVARTVSTAEFGAFSLTFAAYAIALGLSRALTTEPLVVRHSGPVNGRTKHSERAALGASILIGVATGIACAAVGFAISGPYRGLLFALAMVLPGLLLQDALRVVFFVRGQGRRAFTNDLIWAVLLVPTFFAAQRIGASATTMTFAWGVAGAAAAMVGIMAAKMSPSLSDSFKWLRRNWDLTSRYLVETLAITGTQQAYFLLIGAIAGLTAVGQLKLVLVVLGPVNIIIQGIGMAALPEVVRASQRSIRRMDLAATVVSVILSIGALAWGVIVLLLPTDFLARLAGPSWVAIGALVLPLVLLQILNGANTGAYMGLRAMRRANLGVRIRIVSSLAFVLGATGGAAADGARGAAWGLALASLTNLVVWVWGYVRARGTFAVEQSSQSDSGSSAIE